MGKRAKDYLEREIEDCYRSLDYKKREIKRLGDTILESKKEMEEK